MPRAIWSGAISFGLVTVPVRLFSATQQQDVRFRQFQEGTGERIRYKRVAEGTGEEVDYNDIVKGYEIDKGRYVIVTPEELEAVEPTRSRSIDIEDFVDLDSIDPVYFEKTYYLAPTPDVGAEKPYALLHRAMSETNRIAVARFVMRTKQYLATIRPLNGILALETMYFPDEVRSTDDLENVPADTDVRSRELSVARQLIESLSSPWEPQRYVDTYRERVLDLIERKAKGEEIVVERQEETPQVADLMEALRASVEATRSGGSDRDGKGRAQTDYAGMSKSELYDRAQEAEIPGRSKMNKEELAEALRKKAS